ncbi:MAG: response regulator, partial [Pirellulales bacterium]
MELQVVQRTRELQKAKEAADRASQSKSDFLANISHEIRTPLTAVLGFTRLLMDGVDDAGQRGEYLQIIRASAEHQLTLINDLLDVSRIEAGKLEIHRVACSVPEIVDEVLQTLRLRAEQKGLTLASECRSPLGEAVYTDPSRLRQLLLNLVNNALKFTTSGSVRVVMSRTIADGCDKLRIDVIDTGIGIAQDKQGVIFDPFVQADGSIAPRFGGTGLGLTISRSIAGLLGGSLTVTSREGEGSTFTLLVDSERPTTTDVCAQRTTTHDDGAAQAALDGRRILLVEDHPFNRKLISLTLARSGAVVDTAENGQVGLDKASSAAYDLVLMDVQMPVMNGYTATERLREAGYRGPIIALTAHALPAERERCFRAGCDTFVGKPIDLDHLTAVVRQFLSTGLSARCPGNHRRFESSEEDASPQYRQIVSDFLGSLTEARTEMCAALAETNYETLAAIAHTLKGSGGTFGFPELTAAAEQLELA